MVDTSISDITSLVNTISAVTIPAVISLALAIINFINHKTNSNKIHEMTKTATDAIAKVQTLDTRVTANTDKITSGLTVATDLSPQLKDAIVASHPTVVAMQQKLDEQQKKLDELNVWVSTVTADSEGSVKPLGSKK